MRMVIASGARSAHPPHPAHRLPRLTRARAGLGCSVSAVCPGVSEVLMPLPLWRPGAEYQPPMAMTRLFGENYSERGRINGQSPAIVISSARRAVRYAYG